MDVGKGREQERKLFRQPERRKHRFSLPLEPAYSGLRRNAYNGEHAVTMDSNNTGKVAIIFILFKEN